MLTSYLTFCIEATGWLARICTITCTQLVKRSFCSRVSKLVHVVINGKLICYNRLLIFGFFDFYFVQQASFLSFLKISTARFFIALLHIPRSSPEVTQQWRKLLIRPLVNIFSMSFAAAPLFLLPSRSRAGEKKTLHLLPKKREARQAKAGGRCKLEHFEVFFFLLFCYFFFSN